MEMHYHSPERGVQRLQDLLAELPPRRNLIHTPSLVRKQAWVGWSSGACWTFAAYIKPGRKCVLSCGSLTASGGSSGMFFIPWKFASSEYSISRM